MSTPSYDPSREWDNYCEEEERYLANREVCSECGEPIAEDTCYNDEGHYICEHCWDDYAEEHFRVQTPVYDDWEEGDRDE